MLKDTADKLSAADKQAIEEAMEAVKKANEGTDSAAIQRALDQLTSVQHNAAESLYNQGSAAGSGAGPGPSGDGGAAGAGGSTSSANEPKGDVIDAEVVDEGKGS